MSFWFDDPRQIAIFRAEQAAADKWLDDLREYVLTVPGLVLTDCSWAAPEMFTGTLNGRKFYFFCQHERWYLMWGTGPGFFIDSPADSHLERYPGTNSKDWYAEARGDNKLVAFGEIESLPQHWGAEHLKFAVELLQKELTSTA